MDWLIFKTELTDAVGLSRDALHVLAGFGGHVAVVLLARSWFGAIWPVAAIAAIALGNEWLDLANEDWGGEARTWQYWESAKDMAITLAIPLALMLVARFLPARFNRRPSAEPTRSE